MAIFATSNHRSIIRGGVADPTCDESNIFCMGFGFDYLKINNRMIAVILIRGSLMALAQFVLFVNENLQEGGRAMPTATVRSKVLFGVCCLLHLAVGVASCIVGLWIILLLATYVGNGTPMWGSSPGLTDCYSPLGPVSGHRCYRARLAWLIQP